LNAVVSPPLSGDAKATVIARERLRILAIGFYVRGGMMVALGCFFLIYVAFFLGFSFMPESAWTQHSRPAAPPSAFAWPAATPHAPNEGAPPVIIFRIMACMFGAMTFLVWILGCLTAYAGRCIQTRKHKALIYVMAGFNCLFLPYGTLLGVFTFIVLGSPAATGEFKQAAA
jgi:magnesium-transporting ATPase (P-type)